MSLDAGKQPVVTMGRHREGDHVSVPLQDITLLCNFLLVLHRKVTTNWEGLMPSQMSNDRTNSKGLVK